jgi:hypothetical protein
MSLRKLPASGRFFLSGFDEGVGESLEGVSSSADDEHPSLQELYIKRLGFSIIIFDGGEGKISSFQFSSGR